MSTFKRWSDISLLDKLHHDAMNDEKVLVTEKKDLDFTKARLTSAIAFTKHLLSSGDIADIIHLSKQTSEHLKSLTKLKKQRSRDKRTWCFVQKEPPTECSVVLSFCPSFVNPPKKVPHGLNEIDIRAPVRPNVSIMCIQTLAVGTRVVYLGPNWPSPFGTGGHGSIGVVDSVGSDYVIVRWEASVGQSYVDNPPPEVDFSPSYCEVRTEL